MLNTNIRPHENESDKEHIDRIVEEGWRKSVFGRIARRLSAHLRR